MWRSKLLNLLVVRSLLLLWLLMLLKGDNPPLNLLMLAALASGYK
jgi:hypothetical protein